MDERYLPIENILLEAEYNENASAWIKHLTLEERELIENPSELERYKNNIYESVRRLEKKY